MCEYGERIPTHIGGKDNLYWSLGKPILVRFTIYIDRDVDLYETVAESPILYFKC